jgi:hypothetical protein
MGGIKYLTHAEYYAMISVTQNLRDTLQSLRRSHYICDDCWYSCPKSGECCNDAADGKCNCGADEHNAKIDAALK